DCVEAAHGHGREDALARAEAPRAVVPRIRTHRRDANACSGVRRVDETAAADVDAHVSGAVEEDEVAGAERPARDAVAVREVGVGRVRKGDAEVPVDEPDESRAVESAPRSRAAIAVRDADEVARIRNDAGAEYVREVAPVGEVMVPRLGPVDPMD